MDELKKALKDAGLDRVPLSDVFGFNPDCADSSCTQQCEACEAGCETCEMGKSNGS